MPAWKWGPDNADLKLATGVVNLTVSGNALMQRQIPSMAQSVALSVLAPNLLTFSLLRDLTDKIQVICKLIRSGGFPDIELPISSFQVFINNNSGWNIQVTVPDYSLAEAIADRASGSLALYKKRVGSGDIRYLEEIAIIPISSIRDDVGAKNKSITLEARQDG